MKFKDADLLGLPWRITVGAKGLREGQLELKQRSSGKLSLATSEDTQELMRELDEIS